MSGQKSTDAAKVSKSDGVPSLSPGANKGNVAVETFSRFCKGGASGLISAFALQPLQVIKTSMQVSPLDKKSFAKEQLKEVPHVVQDDKLRRKSRKYALKKDIKVYNLTFSEATRAIYSREGLMGFMRGFTPSMLKNTLNAGSYFSMLYYLESLLTNMGIFHPAQVSFMASAMSRTFETIISNPLIVIKTRFEVVGFAEYANTHDAARQILAKEGMGGFFTGLKISLIRDVPFSGIFYPIYNFFKTYYTMLFGLSFAKNDNNRAAKMVWITSLASFSANVVSCTVTHPLDLIRTRVYFQFYNKDQGQHYTGIGDAIKKIYEVDGVHGYFRGLLPRIARKGLGSIIAWGIYEYLVDKKDAMIFS